VEESKARVAEAGVRVELAQAASEQRNACLAFSRCWERIDALSPSWRARRDLPSLPESRRSPAADFFFARHCACANRGGSAQGFDRPGAKQARARCHRQRWHAAQQRDAAQRPSFRGLCASPVFDRNQGNLLEALKLEDKARDELQAATVRLHSEVAQARERLSTIAAEVQSLEQDVLPGAKSAYDAATIGFENGKFNFLEVLDAQRTYFTAKSQYLKALGEAHRAAADIDRLLGASMVSGLIATQH
jgi:cobalt-zinc-cadmium efflux system outer membrane protein